MQKVIDADYQRFGNLRYKWGTEVPLNQSLEPFLEGRIIQVGWWEMSVGSAIRCVEDTEE